MLIQNCAPRYTMSFTKHLVVHMYREITHLPRVFVGPCRFFEEGGMTLMLKTEKTLETHNQQSAVLVFWA